MRALLLDVCRGDDFGGQVKPFAEVIETFGGQSVVIVLPGELGLDEALGGQTLESFDDLGIWNVEVFMFKEVKILLGN